MKVEKKLLLLIFATILFPVCFNSVLGFISGKQAKMLNLVVRMLCLRHGATVLIIKFYGTSL